MTAPSQPVPAGKPLILVEIAPGELLDKITILEIKAERITEADRLHNVNNNNLALGEEEKILQNRSRRWLGASDPGSQVVAA